MKALLFFMIVGTFMVFLGGSVDTTTDVAETTTLRNIYMDVENFCGAKVVAITGRNQVDLTFNGTRTTVKFSSMDVNYLSRFKGQYITCQ